MDERVDLRDVFRAMFGDIGCFICNGEFIDVDAYQNEANRRNAYVGAVGSDVVEYSLYVGLARTDKRLLRGVSPEHMARIVDAVIQWTISGDSPEELWERARQ